ncbi:MAG: hypothetical protein FJ272_22850, partial [Planctomycetes bacterium]|nr:hypothetical protein [Planctomycetota bacterium]
MTKRVRLVVIGVDGGIPTVVERYAREGALPHIARLIERGTFAEACLPAMPTITPTCWATIATGATPAVHGCTCATLHRDGDPLDKTTSAYWSDRVQSEFVWEAAERAGRTALVVAYPTSWPPRLKRGYQIGGPGCGVVEYHTLETSPGHFLVDGAELQFFTTQDAKHELVTRISLSRESDGRLGATLPAQTRHSALRLAPFGWRARFEAGNRVRFVDLRDGAPVVELEAGQWSQDLALRLADGATERRVTCRIKLVDASESGQRLTVLVTPMADLSHRASPSGLGRELNGLGGVPPYWHHGAMMQKRIISHDLFLEIERLNFAWRTQATRHIHSRDPLDLVFHYSVMMDTINHAHRCTIEGYGNADEATRRESADLERRAYGLVDEFVGDMQETFGPEAVIMLVSDHGSCGFSRPFLIRET